MKRKISSRFSAPVAMLLALAVPFSLAGCGSSNDKSGGSGSSTLKVGLIAPYTGAGSSLGKAYRDGANLALKNLKAQGIDVPIKLVESDSQEAPDVAVKGVRKLINQDKVDVLAGIYSSTVCDAALPIVEQSKTLIQVAACISTDKDKWGGKSWFYHFMGWQEDNAEAAVDYLDSLSPKPKTVAAVYANDVTGQGTNKILVDSLKSHGYDLVFNDNFDPQSQNNKALINKAKAAKPDVFMVEGYVAQMILLTKEARDADLTADAFVYPGSGVADPQFIEALGANANGIIGVQPWTPEANFPADKKYPKLFPSNTDWSSQFESEYGYTPGFMAPIGYINIALYGLAYAKAGATDMSDLTKALDAIKVNTPMGAVQYHKNGVVQHQALSGQVTFQIQGGKIVPLLPKAAAPDGAASIYPKGPWQ